MRSVTLYDARGRPIRRRELTQERAVPTTGVRSVVPTTATTGIDAGRLGSILRESETPGAGSAVAFLELAEHVEEVDLHYAGVLGTRKRQVAQIGVTVEPADDTAEAARDADLVREFLSRRRLADELQDLLDAVGKGFSVAEIIWETSARMWMPSRLAWRQPTWFEFDRVDGETLRLRSDEGLTDLAPWKFIVHRSRAKSGLPIRGGLTRIAMWAWLFKTMGLVDWAKFVNAYGHPVRIGRYGPAASKADQDVLARAVANIGTDYAALLPDGMDVEFVVDQTVRGRSELYSDLVNYVDRSLSIAVLGQTLTTDSGSGGSGSYALGQVHDLVRHDIESSDAAQLAETLQRDIAVPIVALNNGPRKSYPRVEIARPPAHDAAEMADVLQKLVPLGFDPSLDEVRERLGWRAPAAGARTLATPARPPMGLASLRDDPTARRADPLGDVIDAIGGEEWLSMAAPIVEPFLRRALADPDGLMRDMAEARPEMDSSVLAERLARILFVAQLWGRGGGDD